MCNEKIKVYSPVNSVSDVIMLFGKLHEQLGFPRLVDILGNNDTINTIEYWSLPSSISNIYSHDEPFVKLKFPIVFEYLSSDYLSCNRYYLDKYRGNIKDIIVCWKDDCDLINYIKNNYGLGMITVIELQNYVEVIPDIVDYTSSDKNHYYLFHYDLVGENYKNNVNWSNSKLFTFKGKFMNIKCGRKALVKQGDYIIGGFDIVRYENIQLLDSSAFVQLYKDFTDSPIGLFSSDINDMKKQYARQYVNHIYYNNFFELKNEKIRKTFKEILPDFEINGCAVQALTEEEYNKLLGIDKSFASNSES